MRKKRHGWQGKCKGLEVTKHKMYLDLNRKIANWRGQGRGVGAGGEKEYWRQIFIIYHGSFSVDSRAAWKPLREVELWSDSRFGKVTYRREKSGKRGDPAQEFRHWQ